MDSKKRQVLPSGIIVVGTMSLLVCLAMSAYAIDAATLTATEAWRFDYGQTIFSDICSGAYETAGKSVLVDYATAVNRTQARLVGLDESHNVVFDFQYASPTPCATSFNAVPVPFEAMTFN